MVFDQSQALHAFVDRGTGCENACLETGVGDHRGRHMIVGCRITSAVIKQVSESFAIHFEKAEVISRCSYGKVVGPNRVLGVTGLVGVFQSHPPMWGIWGRARVHEVPPKLTNKLVIPNSRASSTT